MRLEFLPRACRPRPELVRIVRVMHGAMDIEAQFAEQNAVADAKPNQTG